MDGLNQNPTTPQAEGAASQPAAETSTVKDVMAGMLGNEPGSEPVNGNNGDKDEGSKKSVESNNTPAWTSQLPEELKNNADVMKQLTKFNKIGDLAKSYSELESKLGNSTQLPGENSTQEELDAFYQKLGKPTEAEKYEIPEDDKMDFKKIAYENNLTVSQAKSVYESISKFGSEMLRANEEAMNQAAQKTQEALVKQYGDKLPEQLELAKRGIKDFGGTELGNVLQAAGVLNSLPVVELFIKLGNLTKESVTASKGTGGGIDQYKSIANGGHLSFGKDFK